MDLRDYARLARRSWWIVLMASAVGAGIALAISSVVTPRYVSTAQLYVVVRASGDATTGDVVQGSTAAQQKVLSYVDIASSSRVLGPVIDELGLDVSSRELAESVTATSPEDTALVVIEAADPSAEQSARIADAIATTLSRVVDSIENVETAGVVRLELVQGADTPDSPESPRPVVNTALGALLGIVAGLGLAVLRSTLDTRIRTAAAAEAASGAPAMAAITYDPDIQRRPLIVHSDPHDHRAEAFRTLRTNLRFASVSGHLTTLVITSPSQGEGKTTVACNLAIALADSGARVVLVDADVRRPQVADRMGLEGAAGLTDVLIGRAEVDDVLQPWGRDRLMVLPAGAIPPNPSELLGSQGMSTLLTDLAHEFDHVVIDAAPVLPVTDAAVVSTVADGALMVIAASRTQISDATAARAALDRVGGRVVGVVLSMVPTKGADAYAANNSYYRAESRHETGASSPSGR